MRAPLRSPVRASATRRPWPTGPTPEGEAEQVLTERTPQDQGDTDGLRVAIVDDDPSIRALTRFLLSRHEGMMLVGEAADGGSAPQMLRQLEPDVVLVDLLMPRVSGRELLPWLAREMPRSMVLVLSALDGIDEAEPAFALGAFAYLEKSVVGPRLGDEIAELYGLFRRALAGETVWSPGGPRRLRT